MVRKSSCQITLCDTYPRLELCITFDRDSQDGSCETFATPTGEYSPDQQTASPVSLDIDERLSREINASRILHCKVKQVELNVIQKTYEMNIGMR